MTICICKYCLLVGSKQWKHLVNTPKKGTCHTLGRQCHVQSLGTRPAWNSDDTVPGKSYRHYRSLLCFTDTEITGGIQNQAARNVDQRFPPPRGQCPCSHFPSSTDGITVPQLRHTSSSSYLKGKHLQVDVPLISGHLMASNATYGLWTPCLKRNFSLLG